jgi:hypothetical protein
LVERAVRRALALTDWQLAFVRRGAATLPVHRRDAFLRAIAERLAGEPSDSAVIEAVNLGLDAATAIDGVMKEAV